jgi:hypothetical protein
MKRSCQCNRRDHLRIVAPWDRGNLDDRLRVADAYPPSDGVRPW